MKEFISGIIIGLLAGSGINFIIGFLSAWRSEMKHQKNR